MPKRDSALLVEDMLSAIRKIERYRTGLEREGFLQDEKTIDSVVRNLEIIGEAAWRLPEDFTARYPTVPWQQIAGLRNRIVHEYFDLDLEIIWQVIHHDLPLLKTQLENLV